MPIAIAIGTAVAIQPLAFMGIFRLGSSLETYRGVPYGTERQ